MKYRPEIDGLRTIAVLPVLFYHFGMTTFSGGFTGVDIFFVISGFLITSIITAEIDKKTFTFANFYRRRALRILPPLALVVVATFIAAWMFMLPAEVEELGRTTIATSLFGSNIYFFKAYNYFSVLAESNPLLHTWSLAVEEQFYFVTPIILWLICFIKPLAKYRAHIIALGVIFSFGLSQWLLTKSSEAAFYLLPSRFWELGVGSLIALYGFDKSMPDKLKNYAGILGAGILAYSIFMLDKDDVFPGLNAIYAVAGTALIILAGLQSWTGLILSQKPFVFIGKISYSLYLWHWPLLIFYKIVFLKTHLNLTDSLLLTCLSIVIAYLSWKFWEQPFRKLRAVSSFQTLSVTTIGLIATVCISISILSIEGRWRKFDPEIHALTELTINYSSTDENRYQFTPRGKDCFITTATAAGGKGYNVDACLSAQSNKQPLVFWGDSHSAHLTGPLQDALTDYEVLPLQASGCLPLWPLKGEARCTDLFKKALTDYIPELEKPVVVVSARWTRWGATPDTSYETKLHNLIEKLNEAGASKVIILGPTLEYTTNLPLLMARSKLVGKTNMTAFINQDIYAFDEMMSALNKTDSHAASYISLVDALCERNNCDSDKPLLFDDNHLTLESAHKVAQTVSEQMQNIRTSEMTVPRNKS